MGLSFWKWIRSAVGASKVHEVDCRELFEAAEEYRIREWAFWCCVNRIANALGRCEFRTFRDGREIREREYYLWNVEPNVNQNSTVFLHKLVARLYQDNEALIIPTRRRDGGDALVVADSWQDPPQYPSRQNEYRGVMAGEVSYDKTFYEKDVIHLTLNHCNIAPVLRGLYDSYVKLLQAAMKNYIWGNGQHWKVHVTQMADNEEGWAEQFQRMVEAQIKPFLNNGSGILPEVDGWNYENVAKDFEGSRDASHIKGLMEDILDFTADALLIPPVLLRGQVQGTADATARFLTDCVDPLADQLAEEINRKRYGYEEWRRGSFLRVDTTAIQHFNVFENAANVEKLIGCGYSYNDVQRATGGPEIDEPWANEHFLTLNFARAEDVLNEWKNLKGEKGEDDENETRERSPAGQEDVGAEAAGGEA